MNEKNAKCRFCSAPIPLHKGYCAPCFASYQRDYRMRQKLNGHKNGHNGTFHYFGPGWLMPRVLGTISASIVWGICGRMADQPEY